MKKMYILKSEALKLFGRNDDEERDGLDYNYFDFVYIFRPLFRPVSYRCVVTLRKCGGLVDVSCAGGNYLIDCQDDERCLQIPENKCEDAIHFYKILAKMINDEEDEQER